MSNDINKLIDELKKTSDGQKTVKDILRTDKNALEKQIQNMDKNEMIKKLNQMGLSPLAKKLDGLSTDEIIRGLNSNPKVLDKIKDLLK